MRRFPTKALLVQELAREGRAGDDALIVAQDIPDRGGSFTGRKRFYLCSDTGDYLSALGMPHTYEVIFSRSSTPTWVYADVDGEREGGGDFTEDELEHRTRLTVAKFLLCFGLRKADVGTLVQVSTCHKPSKFSVHVKINAVTTAEECERLLVPLSDTVDVSVYSEFRSYRALYSSKGGKAERLVPWGSSSTRLTDHLVRVLPGHGQAALHAPVLLPREAPGSAAAAGQRRPRARSMSAGLLGDDDALEAMASVWEGVRQARMEARLGTTWESLRANIAPNELRLEDSGTVSVCVGAAGFVCPYAHRTHKSNRGVLRVLPGEHIEFICLDGDCRSAKRIRVSTKCQRTPGNP